MSSPAVKLKKADPDIRWHKPLNGNNRSKGEIKNGSDAGNYRETFCQAI